MLINTGTPRSVKGHAISGGLIACLMSGTKHYHQVKQGNITKEEAIKQTLKETLQGAAITASAIAATNALGEEDALKGSMKAVTYIGAGIIASYLIRTLDHSRNNPQLIEQPKIPGEQHE